MHDKTILILLGICCLAVVAILATGIGGFAKGGEFNRKNGNRLMRWRIIAQAIAVAVFLLYLWVRGH
ncbi:twin transmembrane helix small protein [Paracoccus sp. MBLB3053]|uniref:Twin transmembrane helix small protein n=1 Tax=Paracoccus aurantius TaxID=3073814 RepID=A0ABU2HPS3_9RHOB|nr:twin transmembrane helix small protein [Paracoccus sp. MBLB3053]MDS9466599.1 twin transmembrane helix small protein [Paracoccus sp. MBLB3053]